MTVITITTQSGKLLPKLKQWLKENDATASLQMSETPIVWTDKQLDDATHKLVLNNLERKKNNDKSNLVFVNFLKKYSIDDENAIIEMIACSGHYKDK